ncbi:MAG TPA: hypothetical protein VKB88_06670 [Bryobacteraceae bacterium]|nr:hypothetical protein [Bryobacteraceae bacterium]
MKNCVSSFLSRLALPGLMSLILLSPAIARADTIDINVIFPGGFTGTGSFNTNGTCDPCQTLFGTLTNFTFTVDDDTFTQAEVALDYLIFYRSGTTLMSGHFPGGDDGNGPDADTLGFFPIGVTPGFTFIDYHDNDEGPISVTGTGTVTVVPEPKPSFVLLAGCIGLLVFGLTRRRSARMRGGIR